MHMDPLGSFESCQRFGKGGRPVHSFQPHYILVQLVIEVKRSLPGTLRFSGPDQHMVVVEKVAPPPPTVGDEVRFNPLQPEVQG